MPTLVYFPSRGRAEVIRLALAEVGAGYDEETVKDFAALKASGRLPFLALPIWEEDDGWRLAQSQAILEHVGRAHGLLGRSPRELALVAQGLGAAEDVRNEYRRLSKAGPAAAEVRAELTGTVLPRWFGQLDGLLGDRPFFVGDALTVADLALWYVLELACDNQLSSALAGLPRLGAFFERVAARPRLAAWLASPKRWPVLKLP